MSLSATPAYLRFIDLIRNTANQLRYLFLSEQGGAYADPVVLTWLELPVILQTKIPNNLDIHGQVLLYGANINDFAVLGDQIEIAIETGGTTFKWRKNAGSYTTAVPIAPIVDLGSNGLKAAFQDTTGYTDGDTWIWVRSAYPYDPAELTCLERVPQISIFNTDIYISGVSRNILRMRDDMLTSVGYKRVFGNRAVVFAQHLVVSQFAEGVYDSGNVIDPYDEGVTPFVLAWSDLNDPDNFWSTDINEADQFPVPVTDFPDTKFNGIQDMAELGDVLYIYLPDAIHTMRYVGLPNVMQIEKAPFPKIGSIFKNGLVVSPQGHYFIGRNDFYYFDGVAKPRSIGEAVRKKFFAEVAGLDTVRREWLFGYYDIGKEEVVWTYFIALDGGLWQCRQVRYLERDGKWFFRNVPEIRCQGRLYADQERSVYGGYNAIYRDVDPDEGFTGDYIADVRSPTGDTFTEPYVISQVTKYGLSRTIKEGDAQYLDAKLGTADSLEYAYRTGKYVEDVLNGAFTVALNQWVPSLVEGVLTNPKVAAKTWQHRLTFRGARVEGAKIHEWGDIGLSNGAEK